MTQILFRKSLAEEDEFAVAQKYFDVVEHRTEIKGGQVLCRYSSLPYHKELEQDIKNFGARLVNSYSEHRYVADINNWYWDLEFETPTTWFSLEQFVSFAPEGPYVLKGETNSKKNQWKSHMFAPDKKTAMEVYCRLQDDSLIGHQNIVFRQFEEFVSYGESIVGQPITKEFRVFVLDGKIMADGFYWSIFPEVIEDYRPKINSAGREFLERVVEIVAPEIRFFVIDIAQRSDGEWRVVELNDGCMSGLSCIEPNELYSNLAKIL